MQVFHSLSDIGLVQLLQAGGVGVLPTDTVYGLVCRAADVAAVQRLFTVKKREHKPGTIIAANIDQLVELGIKARYLKAVEQYWPNPLSVQLPHQPDHLSQWTNHLAVRIPDHAGLVALLAQTGPLMTTSANNPAEPTAATVEAAQAYFGDQVDFYVDGGDLSGRPPSTVIQIVDDAIEVLRQGAVNIDENGSIR